MSAKHVLLLSLALALAACGDDGSAGVDGGAPAADGGPRGGPDAAPTGGGRPTGAACETGADCLGGTCLGAPGQPEATNPRFTGGYCTNLACTPNSQNGCGADEWCVEGGPAGAAGYCVELCSKAEGMTCARADHVCLGLGTWGGCFAQTAVECDSSAHTGCPETDICVRIGFDDPSLGRCETLCDPMVDGCGDGTACYYIRRYNTAFCGTDGTTPPEEICSCDKCCVPGYACTPDPDGAGRHCKAYCVVADGCAGGTCVPLEPGSPWGGCVAPGSAGT